MKGAGVDGAGGAGVGAGDVAFGAAVAGTPVTVGVEVGAGVGVAAQALEASAVSQTPVAASWGKNERMDQCMDGNAPDEKREYAPRNRFCPHCGMATLSVCQKTINMERCSR